jgi:tRNA A-37 threonylcarbamoyl transferase component Bud32
MPDAPPRPLWRVEGIAPDPAVAARLRWDAPWPWPEDAASCGRNVGREVRRLDGERPLLVKGFAPGRVGTARRESRMLACAAAAGVGAPRCLAELARRDGARCLVLEPLDGRPLLEALRACRGEARRRLLSALADALAKLGRAGLEHRQLHAWHLLASGCDAEAPVVFVVDWAEARARRIGRRDAPAAGDLAALFSTIGRRDLSLAERCRLLTSLVPARSMTRCLAAIRRSQVDLFRKGRLPDASLPIDFGSPAGRVLAGRRAAASFGAAAGSAETWLEPSGAVVVRQRDGRANLVWRAPPGDPGATWYGKRFERPGRRWPLRSRAPAFDEWVRWRALDAIGLEVPEVVAVARLERGASVIWTRGVTPGESLYERLPRIRESKERRAALLAAARIARRLHAAGFVHRDLYLDHFLVAGGSSRLVLIDPSRVGRHVRIPVRHRIKDLAALEFSARAAGASRTERWRALLEYVHGRRAAARRLAVAALHRAARIAAHERRNGRPGPPA